MSSPRSRNAACSLTVLTERQSPGTSTVTPLLNTWTGETGLANPPSRSSATLRDHEVAIGSSLSLQQRTLTSNAPAARSSPVREACAGKDHHTSALTWLCFGTAAAALGTAVVIEASAGDKSPKLEPSTAFFAGLGAASATFGGVLLYFDLSTEDPPKVDAPSQPPASALSLGLAPGGGFASYRAAF